MVINDLLPVRDLSSGNFFKPFLNLFILLVSSTSLAFDSLLPAHKAAGQLLCLGLGFEGPFSVSFVGCIVAS